MSESNEFPAAVAETQVENDLVCVTRWRFPPGTATGWHVHARNYVVVPTVGGVLTMIGPDGARATSEMMAGKSYYRESGVEHNVVNLSDQTVEFVEIELPEH